jgi:hypothetical protein
VADWETGGTMITNNEARELAKMLCICEDGFTCPSHMFLEIIENQEVKIKRIQSGNKSLISKHNANINCLQHYYHIIHKNCPCLTEDKDGIPGKCESGWITITPPEETKKLNREQELKAISEFMEQKDEDSSSAALGK